MTNWRDLFWLMLGIVGPLLPFFFFGFVLAHFIIKYW